MKRLNFLCVLALLFICATFFTQSAIAGNYNIRFKVKGYTYPHALIAYYFADKQYVIDTVDLDKEGYYTFKGDSIMRGGIYLFAMVKEKKDTAATPKLTFEPLNYFEFLIDPKDNQQFTLETDSTDLNRNMKVQNSKQNEIFYKDILFIADLRVKAEALSAKLSAAKDSIEKKLIEEQLKDLDRQVKEERGKLIAANPGMMYTSIMKAVSEIEIPESPEGDDGILDPDFRYKYAKKHYWDNIDLTDDRLLRTPILEGKIMFYLDKMVIPAPDSLIKECSMLINAAKPSKQLYKYMIVTLLNKYANSKIMGQDGVYADIAMTYYCSPAPGIKPIAREWTDSVQCAKICDRGIRISYTKVGYETPPITVQAANDKWESVYDIKADYTVLYFWDYDCGHCKKITPQLVKVAKAYADASKKVQFYTVATDGTREIWKEKMKEMGLDLPNIINTADPTRATGFDIKYDIQSTPQIFLVDKDKKILLKKISIKQLDEYLNHAINGKKEPLVIFEEDAEHKGEEAKEGATEMH